MASLPSLAKALVEHFASPFVEEMVQGIAAEVEVVGFEEVVIVVTSAGVTCADVACADEGLVTTLDDGAIADTHEGMNCADIEGLVKGIGGGEMETLVVVVAACKCWDRVKMGMDEV